ncbi:Dynactin subunit 2, partial [Caligus rogercresseyi]
LSQLDNVQEKLVASLGNNQKLLEETKSKIDSNLSTIQTNFSTVEKRLEKLTSK